MISTSPLLLVFALMSAYPDHVQWKLAFNINANDKHSFRYAAGAWENDENVGTSASAFTADYKSLNVTHEIANFIAIVRHQDGVCEAVKVWEFLTQGNKLRSYLDSKKTKSSVATYNNIYTYTSPSMLDRKKDPIFAVDGALTFNWRWSDNGVRIGNSGWCNGGLPKKNVGTDNYNGLGNDHWMGSDYLWFDVGVNQEKCQAQNRNAQGSDHGISMKGSKLLGQYAIYVSDSAAIFSCKNLQVSMVDPIAAGFDRADRTESRFLTFEEFIFDFVDKNGDGVISMFEYAEARANDDLGETATGDDFQLDFNRIDKDNDAMISFGEFLFDTIDIDKDHELSPEEYVKEHESD